jgi:hypothetical protein
MKLFNENNPNHSTNQFGLPENYFHTSAQSIVNKIEWQDEHKIFPILVKLKSDTHFKIPQNYFNNSEIKLELIDFKILNSIYKINNFNVPSSYFEDNEVKQFSTKMIDVDLELFSKLNSIKKENNFKTNETYFTDKKNKLTSTLVKKNKDAKIIRFNISKSIYAVAALLIIVLGLWMFSIYTAKSEFKDCGTLACVDKSDLIKSKQLENFDNEDLYEVVNSKTLEQNLEQATNIKMNDSSLQNNLKEDLIDEL